MKTTICRNLLGIVMELNLAEKSSPFPFSARVVVNHLQLDDDGNICLSASGDLQETLDRIDALKSELDQLASECVLTTARDIAFNQAREKFIRQMGGGVSSRSDEVSGQPRTSSLLAFKRRTTAIT